ncbi:MAG: ThiF family adenylyltransferase [Candidatus Izimaplasma sp.]|nr:ThiF family adenylyltransferase [Candidatus Izimaplasma bacterium]
MIFDRLIKQIGKQKFKKLSTSSVLVLGIGGVGGHAIEALARSGIGTLYIVDSDRVEESNINRQIIALTSTINQPKTTLMKDRIQKINPACQVITYPLFYSDETKASILDNDIDFIIDCIDTTTYKIDLIVEAHKRDIPMITSLGMGNKRHPECLMITTLDKTTYDPIARIMRKKLRDKKIDLTHVPVVFSSELPVHQTTNSRTPTSNAFVPASAGILCASYVFNKLIDDSFNA